MPGLSWFSDWQAIVAALQPWLLAVLGVAILALALFGALVRRHSRSSKQAAAMKCTSTDVATESDVPDFLRQRAADAAPAQPSSFHRASQDNSANDLAPVSAGDDRAVCGGKANAFGQHLGIGNFRVLTVTSNPKRIASMMEPLMGLTDTAPARRSSCSPIALGCWPARIC